MKCHSKLKIICTFFICVFYNITVFSIEETIVQHDPIKFQEGFFGSRPWREPKYETQKQFLGYKKNLFEVPKGLEKRVDFWKKIYTEYSTYQGVIHDSEDVDKIYDEVDFSKIISDANLNPYQKEKAKQKLVDSLKKKIKDSHSELKISDLRFQLGQKDRIETAIYLSGRYIEDFEDIFEQNNLPIELVRLIFVESSFNVLARSKVGASGLWQIMPSNARPYKMMTKLVDKRNHPLEATKLAARILRNNFSMLEDWSLAITGYNHGPTGVLKITRKYKTTNIVDLIENVNSRKTFGFASKNFYASFLAILDVEKNAKKYFSQVMWSKKIPGENIKLKKELPYRVLAKWFDNKAFDLQLYNPHLTRHIVVHKKDIPAHTWITVPEKNYLLALAELTKLNRQPAGKKLSVDTHNKNKP